ncbi:MAG: R3H domain-containing nucleic acid-binding protein [bacterium]|nr:R3H domain-containing nucleic acid-binding protein [bacterium]
MISIEDLEKIKNITREFFQKTTFEMEINFLISKEETVSIQIQTDEPQILIGEGGQTLADIQHLLKAILKKNIPASFYIDLDINDYKSKKNAYLKELARTTADEVALTKQEKQLPQLSSYERRIIHMELAEREDVVTESIGQEHERQLIIKPRL